MFWHTQILFSLLAIEGSNIDILRLLSAKVGFTLTLNRGFGWDYVENGIHKGITASVNNGEVDMAVGHLGILKPELLLDKPVESRSNIYIDTEPGKVLLILISCNVSCNLWTLSHAVIVEDKFRTLTFTEWLKVQRFSHDCFL